MAQWLSKAIRNFPFVFLRSGRQRWSTLFRIGLFVECVAVEGSCWPWLRRLRARRWTMSQGCLFPRFGLRDFEFALTVSRKELTPRAKVVYFLVLVTACFRLVIQLGVADGKLKQVDGQVLVSFYGFIGAFLTRLATVSPFVVGVGLVDLLLLLAGGIVAILLNEKRFKY